MEDGCLTRSWATVFDQVLHVNDFFRIIKEGNPVYQNFSPASSVSNMEIYLLRAEFELMLLKPMSLSVIFLQFSRFPANNIHRPVAQLCYLLSYAGQKSFIVGLS